MRGLYRSVYSLVVAEPVPFAIETPDRVRKERYYDPDFYALEVERLWPRVWQMACRLEEIPQPNDFVEYEILDQSVIVLRTAAGDVRAFENACRHRGVRVVEGRGTCESGFVCPFHGWCYGADGGNTHVPRAKAFSEHNLHPGEIDLVPVRCETWGGCAWINLDTDALPLRQCLEPSASVLDGWRVESLRTDWWYSCRLPVNWKLAQEAFVEQYHVVETHPQLVIPGRYGSRKGEVDPRAYIAADLRYLHTMSDGMAGMVHANDVAVAERLRAEIELPDDPDAAIATWHRELNDAVTAWHRERGDDIPDLSALAAQQLDEPMGYCFPHWFVLPMYSSASSYRFRPLGPEETLMEIWSLTRFPADEARERPVPPEPWECDDARWPPIPAQDFSNLPRQQRGLHARGFEYMRLSERMEGHISNFHRTIDGYLAGLPTERLLPALREVNVNPLERAIADFEL
ncbi:MAG TPA: aromatic ring-hydroxylating dioxygenase subunit alpha [Acidimicrobiia bacterium]|jgi:phenylpropionate dioxygenase-like ring-hydroxylating dioxygenase large terminal subunit|nr:aromatic ring-hydroxylating dioxygenase subunit alpha [Acidimicrobiia bacterium]